MELQKIVSRFSSNIDSSNGSSKVMYEYRTFLLEIDINLEVKYEISNRPH